MSEEQRERATHEQVKGREQVHHKDRAIKGAVRQCEQQNNATVGIGYVVSEIDYGRIVLEFGVWGFYYHCDCMLGFDLLRCRLLEGMRDSSQQLRQST